jgi:hypothetical protein
VGNARYDALFLCVFLNAHVMYADVVRTVIRTRRYISVVSGWVILEHLVRHRTANGFPCRFGCLLDAYRMSSAFIRHVYVPQR